MRQPGCEQIATRGRVWVVVALLGFSLAALKLVYIQIIQHTEYRQQADRIQDRMWPIKAPRGNIYDRTLRPLALNLKTHRVAADPGLFTTVALPGQQVPKDTPASVAEKLSLVLHRDQGELLRTLQPDGHTRFVRIVDSVDEPTARTIEKMHLAPIIVDTQWQRAYPHGKVAASVLGFVGRDGDGLSGIERRYEKQLAGRDGKMFTAVDGRLPRSRSEIPGRSVVTQEMTPGGSVILTLELAIQAIAEEELANAVEQAKAAGGTAIVMDPHTGEVLALASQPGFDPNEFWKAPKEYWAPHAVASPYEPGSTFKVITVSAAFEEQLLDPKWTYHCIGSQAVGKRRVNCAQHGGTSAHGTLTLDEIIIESCNSGAATVAMKLGKTRLHKWIKRFGFGERTGIELAGESGGIVWKPESWSQMQLANVGFGQGISVTPFQLLSAYCAIANGGYRIRPRLVKGTMAPDGRITYSTLPKPTRILSQATSEWMRHAMTEVIESEKGTGSNAWIADRTTAGKTGTAQKPTPEAGFRSGKYIGSFCGFAPAKDPKLAIIVVIDEPKNGYYGGVVAAPAFREIAARALAQLGVPPDRQTPYPGPGVSVAMARGD